MEWMEWVEMESMEWNQDTLGTFEVAATLGEEALGAQVISMASSPSDVLAVKLMQASASANATCRSIAVVGDGVIPSHLMSSLLVSSHLVSFGLISLDGCGRETAVILPIAPPLLLASGPFLSGCCVWVSRAVTAGVGRVNGWMSAEKLGQGDRVVLDVKTTSTSTVTTTPPGPSTEFNSTN